MRVTINKNEREKILSLYRTEDLYSFEHNISRFTSLLESTIGDVKPLIIEQNEIKEIERTTDPFYIANWLRRSPGTFNDNEAWAEAAFNQIANYTEYQKVAKELKQDPYKFCKSFMDVTKRYHKNSIENHYKKKNMANNTQKYYLQTNTTG